MNFSNSLKVKYFNYKIIIITINFNIYFIFLCRSKCWPKSDPRYQSDRRRRQCRAPRPHYLYSDGHEQRPLTARWRQPKKIIRIFCNS